MSGWVLFAWLAFVWLLAMMLEALQSREGEGVSIFPVIPIVPLLFLGIAKLVDQAAAPWGTRVIAWLHAVMAVGLVVAIVRGIQTIRKRGEPPARSPEGRPESN